MTSALHRFKARRKLVEQGNKLDQMDAAKKKAAIDARLGIKTKPASGGALEKKKARRSAEAEEGGTGYAELDRIVRLEVVDPLDPGEVRAYTRKNLLESAWNEGFRLYDEQANGLFQYEEVAGGFHPIGVGWGKTLLGLMTAEKGYQKGLRKIALFVQSDTLSQLVVTDIPYYRRIVPMSYPVHVLGGKARRDRQSLAKSNKRGLYVIPYSLLSTEDSEENLFDINPELVIGDEVQNLSNRGSARSQRFLRFADESEPEFVAMSGTITKKSIEQYEHLIKLALKEHNPLPNSSVMAREWGAVIDAEAEEVTSRSATGPLKPLIWWAMKHFPKEDLKEDQAGFRKAFKLRLNSAPGVVASGENEIGTSLTITTHNIRDYVDAAGESYEKLEELMDKVELEWVTPNGDEIEHAIHTWKWLFELSAGFYNELVWPDAQVYADRKDIPLSEAEDLIDQAMDAHRARQKYAKELRDWLTRHAKQGLDTPLLVANNMSNHGAKNVGSILYEAWTEWKEIYHDDLPDREANAVYVCDYKVRAAIDWAKKTDGGLIWYYHQAVGKWLFEHGKKEGLDVLHCPAGKKHNDIVRDPANRDKIIIASQTAHGTGKNLQHHQNNYVIQWPRPADRAEQLLGRTHRNGQSADELHVWKNDINEFDCMNFASCLNDSLYIHQTTGTRQKLIYCNYDPMPKIFPSSVLRERGAEVRRLTREQEIMLKNKFGEYENAER